MSALGVDQLPPPLDPSQCVTLASIHAASFPLGWSADAFASLIGGEGTACFLAGQEGPGFKAQLGFILVRAIAGEAEILTLAVLPEARRQGIAQRLLRAAIAFALARKADTLYLEVSKQNAAAIGLYRGAGFAFAGERPAYYESPRGTEDAWIMRLSLRPGAGAQEGR